MWSSLPLYLLKHSEYLFCGGPCDRPRGGGRLGGAQGRGDSDSAPPSFGKPSGQSRGMWANYNCRLNKQLGTQEGGANLSPENEVPGHPWYAVLSHSNGGPCLCSQTLFACVFSLQVSEIKHIKKNRTTPSSFFTLIFSLALLLSSLNPGQVWERMTL